MGDSLETHLRVDILLNLLNRVQPIAILATGYQDMIVLPENHKKEKAEAFP